MKHSKLFFTFLTSALIVGCGAQVTDSGTTAAKKTATEAEKALTEAKTAVLATLKDPDSAKFGQWTVVNDELACLDVNAKNSYGGYTGMQSASMIKENGKWEVMVITKYGHDVCVQAAKSAAKKTSQ